MPAHEHLNMKLFHGSQHPFKIGEHVTPQGHASHAYATNDPIYAEGIGGGNVFEVSPLNTTDVEETTDSWEDEEGTKTFQSPSGFKVISKHR
jgi:hypothetical protein